LQRAYADGSLQALWRTHFLPSLALVDLGKRQVILLQNPLLDNLEVSFVPDFMPLLDGAGKKPQPE
jgi:hypothetical protein